MVKRWSNAGQIGCSTPWSRACAATDTTGCLGEVVERWSNTGQNGCSTSWSRACAATGTTGCSGEMVKVLTGERWSNAGQTGCSGVCRDWRASRGGLGHDWRTHCSNAGQTLAIYLSDTPPLPPHRPAARAHPQLRLDGVVYLSTSPATCLARLRRRARPEEGAVPLAYLEQARPGGCWGGGGVVGGGGVERSITTSV